MTTTVNSVDEVILVTWHEVTPTTWVAKRGAVSVGLIEQFALFVVTDAEGILAGFFSTFAEARNSIEHAVSFEPRGQYRGQTRTPLRTLTRLLPGMK